MNLAWCTIKKDFAKIEGDYYCTGSFPDFVPKVCAFFDVAYLMIKVNNISINNASNIKIVSELNIIETRSWNLPAIGLFIHSFINMQLFKRIQSRADVIVMDLPTAFGYIGYLLVLKKPLVTIVGGDEQITARSSSSPIIKLARALGYFRLTEAMEKKILQRSALIICRNNQFREKAILRYNIPESRINIITNGIDTELFKPYDFRKKCIIKQSFGSSNDIFLGFVATEISHAKGIDILIKAFAKIRDRYPLAKMLLIGNCRDHPEFDGSIIQCGLVTKKDLPFYYNAMDIFIFPSRSEGAPKVVMEALACGIPVIASDVGGIPELIKEAETGFVVQSENAEIMADLCIKLLEDNLMRTEMGKKARTHAINNFGIDILAKKNADVIRRAVEIQ